MTPELETLYERARLAQRDVRLTKAAYDAAIAARRRAFAALKDAGESLASISNVVEISRQAVNDVIRRK